MGQSISHAVSLYNFNKRMDRRTTYGVHSTPSQHQQQKRRREYENRPMKSNHSSLCILASIFFLATVASIAYFAHNTNANAHSQSPSSATNSFFEKPDNTGAYPSQIEWGAINPKK